MDRKSTLKLYLEGRIQYYVTQTDHCRGAARVGFGSGAVFDKFNRMKGCVLRLYSETVQDAKLYAVMNEKHDNRYNNHSYNSPITPSPSGFSGGTDTLNSRNAEVPRLCCLSSRGRCYFMVLLNLVMNAAILGILIVLLIPFFEPIYLWIFGVLFLFFGSLTLLVTVRFYKMGMKEEATSCFFFLC